MSSEAVDGRVEREVRDKKLRLTVVSTQLCDVFFLNVGIHEIKFITNYH